MTRLIVSSWILAGIVSAQQSVPTPKPAAAPKPQASPEAPWTKKNPWGEPDLSGVWQQRFVGKNGRPVVGLDLADFVEIPYQTWSKEKYEFNSTPQGQATDPEGYCLPAGVPRATGLPYPIRLIQQPGLIVMLIEGNIHSFRIIKMPAEGASAVRSKAEDLNPTWMGHSVGRWEGGTLVVETAGFNDKTWLDPGGHVHTDQMRTTERFTRLTENRLQYEFTIDDPGAYAKPWGWSYVLEGHHDWEIIEYVCNENNKDLEHLVQGPK